jgi:hypothetical protein
MSEDQPHPWVGLALGAVLAGVTTPIAGFVLDGPRSLAVGLGLATPILLFYGSRSGDAFDREGYLGDHSTDEMLSDMIVIALLATVAGVVGVTAVMAVTGSQVVVYGTAAGATFLGGYTGLYARQPEYIGAVES